MKALWVLAVGSFVVLGVAAVWMGGLNQDEGWYLYAANMVADGKLPYRDFFYTQGPIMPFVYSLFAWIWRIWGLLGARIVTLFIGAAGIVYAVAIAWRIAPEGRRRDAALVAFLLLGSNLYHVYYLTIPKTYALASLFAILGFYAFFCMKARVGERCSAVLAGLAFAFAAGTRISLGALLASSGLCLLAARRWRELAFFCIGGAAGLVVVYGPFIVDSASLSGLVAAQSYHTARGGFDMVWTVGSISRLVRWYLPVMVLCGLCVVHSLSSRRSADDAAECATYDPFAVRLLVAGFAAVFVVQMLAPFPYEDYQVPVMALLAVVAAVSSVRVLERPSLAALLALGMTFACSFGSPLLEKWATNGQDRFWSLKKSVYELPQLRKTAAKIESLDPGGKELLTQDLYLAIETGRKVPAGLEMGPFAMLSDGEWRALIESAPCPVAALSGYTFAIEPPSCAERPLARQMEYWGLLKRRYDLVESIEAFGQNATTLLILKRK